MEKAKVKSKNTEFILILSNQFKVELNLTRKAEISNFHSF